MKKLRAKRVALMCLLSFLLLSCSKSSSSYGNNNPPPTTPPVSSNAVTIDNMSFAAAAISIDKGVTVTWTNNDAAPHTVTADDNGFTSANLNKGDTYSHTFNTSGTVPYHCAIHPGMKGSVVVK